MDPTSCPVCHALTLDLAAHTAYHLAVAAADVIVLPTITVPDVPELPESDTAPTSPDVPTTEPATQQPAALD